MTDVHYSTRELRQQSKQCDATVRPALSWLYGGAVPATRYIIGDARAALSEALAARSEKQLA